MGNIKRFEDLIAWQKGHNLILEVFKSMRSSNLQFDVVLNNQMKRSAISICSNIAEGFDRNSDKQMIYFLRIARGSAAELRAQILIARDLEIVSFDIASKLYALALEVSKILGGLIKYISNSNNSNIRA